MKSNLLLSTILILVFLSALGGSIFNATYAFVGAVHSVDVEDTSIDNAEDISLEDVVPVDPFLGSIGFTKPELGQMVMFENIKCGLFGLTQNLLSSPSPSKIVLLESSCGEKWLSKGRWLDLGNLRL
ncbi:hypothetical protein KA183_00155 [bacterium]|nr:hypothetical protein [bacterium]QQR57283.1 MAG: hypothetical protein IPG59_20240 [Candidatus Melainabacteria bacterium]